MNVMLADAQSVFLVSLYKPLIMLVVFAGWGWVATRLDKDMAFYYLSRPLWNGMLLGAAALAGAFWLLIPWFVVGMVLAVALLAGSVVGYAMYRNTKVPEGGKWGFSLDSFRQRVEAAQVAAAQKHATLKMLNPDQTPQAVPAGEDPMVAAHQLVQDTLEFALPRRAEKIDLLIAGSQQVALVVTVDGVKYPQPSPEAKVGLAVIDYIKKAARLDVTDRRRRQVGQALIDAGDYGRHTLGLTTSGSTREISLSIRIDPNQRMAMSVDTMGLLPAQAEQVKHILSGSRGLVIVASPSHQGQTTTLYSLLKHHDPYTQSIVTLEDDVPFEIEGVNHNTLEPGLDPESGALAQRVAGLLRQDPQVFMLSRLTDAQTAKTLAGAATGARLYVGLKQDDTFVALKAWVKAVGDPALASKGLAAIISQRLVRRLCPTCRVSYTPDPALLKKLNLPVDRVGTLYKHSGQVLVKNKPQACPSCMGMGYIGRTAVYEVMLLDDQARQLVAQGQVDALRSHLRKQKMLWLQEAGVSKVVDGVTSISEITRAMGKD